MFFHGVHLYLQKQYIFGLPAEVLGSLSGIQGSPGPPAPLNMVLANIWKQGVQIEDS